MPEDPVAVRKLMEQLPLPERQRSERVLVEDRHVPGPSDAPEVPVRMYTPATLHRLPSEERARVGVLPQQ